MNPIVRFDFAVLHFLNQYAGQSPLFDRIVGNIEVVSLVKGGLFLAVVWGMWFRKSDAVEGDRERIMRGILATIVAIAVTQVLNLGLPLRLRPRFEPGLDFVATFGNFPSAMGKTSFPSDHAAMFFALATMMWLKWRRLGLIAYLYTLVVVCLPRIYVGDHYPSDILAGAAIGIGSAYLFQRLPLPKSPFELLLRRERAYPARFYAVAFLATAQMAALFDDVRVVVHGAKLFLHFGT